MAAAASNAFPFKDQNGNSVSGQTIPIDATGNIPVSSADGAFVSIGAKADAAPANPAAAGSAIGLLKGIWAALVGLLTVDTVVKGTGVDRGGLTQGGVTAAAVVAGGTGNAVGDVLTLVGGTLAPGGVAAQVTASAVTSGAVTAVTVSRAGAYVAAPTGTLATTSSGAGTGATLTATAVPIAFQVMAANSSRRGTKIKSPATNTGTIWVTSAGSGTADYNSFDLLPGDYLARDPHEVGTGAVSMIGSAIGLPFYAREF